MLSFQISQPKSNHKETYSLVSLIVVLLIISILTAIANVIIIYKLRLVPGFEFFTFNSDSVVIHKDAYIERVLLAKNRIHGLKTITGNIELQSGPHTKLKLNSDGIQIVAPKGFEVCDLSDQGQRLFPFNFSDIPLSNIKTLSVPKGIKDVKMIRSPIDEDLRIEAKESVIIRGNNGVRIDGRQVTLEANNFFLSSINSSIVMDAHQGIYLNMDSFRHRIVSKSNSSTANHFSPKLLQNKLCVCGKNGRLFQIKMKDASTTCADVRFPQSDNPCM